MRLTLRALLAWMDNNLPPEDADIIAQKIAESERATGLKNQIQSVMKIPFLPASIILDSTPMGDPNTAAEYLDNNMSPNETVEYEKHCIHSDVVLAEVASCHQILTMVLGEPAEVDTEVRRRVYEMHEKYFSSYNGNKLPTVADVMNELTSEITSPAIEDASSNREVGKGRVFRAVLVAAVLIILFWGMGRLFPQSSVGRMAAKLLPGLTSVEQVSPETQPEPAAGKELAGGEQKQPASVPPVKPVPEDKVVVVKPEDVRPDPAPVSNQDNLEVEDSQPELVFDPELANGNTEPDEDIPAYAHVTGGGSPPVSVDIPQATPLDAPAVPVEPETSGTGIIRVPPPKRVGKMESPGAQVVAEFNAREKVWGRLASQAGVMTGSTLVSFPLFRPVVSFDNQVYVTFVGASQLRVGQSAGLNGAPVLSVDYGRFLFETFDDAGAAFPGTVLAGFPGYAGRLCFAQENTRVAIEVHRQNQSLQTPEGENVPLNIFVHVLSGIVVIQTSPEAEAVAIPAGSFVRLSSAPLDPVIRAAPVWVEPEEHTSQELVLMDTLAKTLSVGTRVERDLLELTEDKNKEVCWMAARCLGQLGNFSLIVIGLSKQEESGNWNKYVDELRQALLRGQEQAIEVQRAFERYYGQKWKRPYRMLWTYQPPRMYRSDALSLVDALNDEDTSVRVLAHWNLQRFYRGEKAIAYKPESSATQRSAGVQQWREYVNQNPDIFIDEP